MPQIEWRTKKENPGPYDTRYGHVDGADPHRFVIEWNKELGAWSALDEERMPDGNRAYSLKGKYVECVDWCWQRLPAHQSPTQQTGS